MAHAFFAPPRPRLMAHRGASGAYPENTMDAFAHAVEGGITYLETDVHATADGHLVLHHDATVDRTTNGSGEIRRKTLRDVQDLDAGYRATADGGATFPHRGRGIRIPTLADALEAFPAVKFNMEAKQSDPPIVQAIIDLVADLGRLDDVLIACEGDRVRDQLDAADRRGMPRNYCGSEVLEFMQAVFGGTLAAYAPPAPVLQIPEVYEGLPVLSAELLAAAHVLGLEAHIWTVNDPADMRRLLDMGVDGVMSDYPLTLLDVAGQRSAT